MKARTFGILILFNVVLVVGAIYFFHGTRPENTSSRPTVSSAELRKNLRLHSRNETDFAGKPKIVYVTNAFNWSQVESSDYRKYIANLRGIGCPESTIKDIILTDIMKLYAARRGQFYHNGREFKFWETDEKRKLNVTQLEEREKQLAEIDKEIPAVLRELLGINYERELNKYFVDTNEDERRLNFLPEDKRSQIRALGNEFEGMRERILDAANGRLSPEDIAALKKVEAQRNAELGKILSDSELAEFELRTSPTADKLRADLIGFNPSEAEFRRIFELENSVAEKFEFADTNNESVAREKTIEESAIQSQLKQEWGDARFADYQQAQNPDFREAHVFAEVYELPPSTAQSILDIQRIAENERQNLLMNFSISREQRLEALKAVQTETERTLEATLGAKAFAGYKQNNGKWIQNLGAN